VSCYNMKAMSSSLTKTTSLFFFFFFGVVECRVVTGGRGFEPHKDNFFWEDSAVCSLQFLILCSFCIPFQVCSYYYLDYTFTY